MSASPASPLRCLALEAQKSQTQKRGREESPAAGPSTTASATARSSSPRCVRCARGQLTGEGSDKADHGQAPRLTSYLLPFHPSACSRSTPTSDTGPDATHIVGLHGVLDRHPWIDRVSTEYDLDEDASSLAVKRAAAYAWSSTALAAKPADNLWDHNDADGDWTQDGGLPGVRPGPSAGLAAVFASPAREHSGQEAAHPPPPGPARHHGPLGRATPHRHRPPHRHTRPRAAAPCRRRPHRTRRSSRLVRPRRPVRLGLANGHRGRTPVGEPRRAGRRNPRSSA